MGELFLYSGAVLLGGVNLQSLIIYIQDIFTTGLITYAGEGSFVLTNLYSQITGSWSVHNLAFFNCDVQLADQ